ncbi:hypothetical protein JCM8097_009420 [Rhodosporidiobolus ruineniae]
MTPKLVVHRQVASASLVDAFPGGQMLDLTAFAKIKGEAVSGYFPNLGTEPEFDVVYPVDEVKYVTSGELKVIEDGKTISAGPGDVVFFPQGSSFRILPTKFDAF